MPSRPKIALKLPKPPTELAVYSKHIYSSMLEDARFKTSGPTFEKLHVANTAFDEAIVRASTRALGTVEARDAAQAQVVEVIRILAHEVQTKANEDPAHGEEIIAASGFQQAESHTHGPQQFSIVQGVVSGEAIVTVPVFEPDAMYFVEVSTDEGKSFVSAGESHKTRFTLSALAVHTPIAVRWRATGRGGRRLDWSEPVSYFVT